MNNIAFRMEEVKSRQHLSDDLFHKPDWQPALLVLHNLESQVMPKDFKDRLSPFWTIEARSGSFSAPRTGQTSPGEEATPALPVLSQYMWPNIVVAESKQDPRKAHNTPILIFHLVIV